MIATVKKMLAKNTLFLLKYANQKNYEVICNTNYSQNYMRR